MNWIPLTSEEQLKEIKLKSATVPQVIFKHSTRCSTSSMVLHRLERSAAPEHMDFYFLDLLRYRDLSNQVAEDYQVYHQSPQILLIKNGECMYDESHMAIQMDEILAESSK
jgi:bacillithiol system protein YtxJ